MPYPLPLTRTEAYLAYKAGVIQQSDLKPSLDVPRNGIDAWLAYWTGLAEDYPKKEDGTPHILQEEEAYIAYLCGVINEYPEKCLRRVGEYLRYLISARWGRPDHPLNREELYLSLLKTQVIPSGDPSSDIVIDGTAKAPFVDVKMYGDTYQQTYTGKNLLGLKKPSSNTFGFEPAVAEESGTITVDGTFTGGGGGFPWISDRQLSIPAGTYTFSMKNPQSFNVSLRMFDAQGQYTSGKYIAAGATSGTFTLEYDCVRVAILIGAFSAGKTLNNQKFEELQLEAGSTSTSFEPFVGGQPSPNPDYPQPIQTVTGEQTVVVTGKNLLNAVPYATPIQQGVKVTITNTNTIHIEGTSTQAYVNLTRIFSTNLPAGTYTMSINKELPFRVNLSTILSGGGSLDRSIQAGETSVTFTTSETTTGMRIFMSTGGAGIVFDETFTVQLVSGNAADYDFEPYSSANYPISLGSIELCKIGTYQDYIYKDGEDWKVHKATVSAIIDGSESWGTSGTNTFYVANIYSKIGDSIQSESTGEMYASHFTIADITSSNTLVGASLKVDAAHNVSNLRIRLQDMSGGTAGFRQMLSAKNPSIYARRLTPTDTTITDSNLIAQLEALVDGGAEDGTTYIKVNATDPNLPGLLYVEAPKYE